MMRWSRGIRYELAATLVLVLAGWLPQATAGEKRGGTLTIVRPTDPVSLDSNLETTAPGGWVYFNITEPLLTLDEQGKLQPKLATSWKVMSPTKLRFTLRPNVKFHDGTPFNAAAVKFTLDRAFNEKPGARWASLAGPFAGAEVVDDLTVDITTKEPYGPSLRSLAMVYVGIVSPTAVKKFGQDYGRNPVGTGPFKFVEWKTNTSITLGRNTDYWGDKALLDRVVFRVVPEEGARMIALRTGEADMVLIPSPAELPALKRDGKFTVYEVVGGRIIFVGMNVAKPPMDDVRVRQALLHSVNVSTILENILEGAAVQPRGYLAPTVFGFKDMGLEKLYPYDKAKARALFKQAGWTPGSDGILQKNGQKMSLSWLGSRGRYLKDAEMAEAVQAQLKEVGVDAKLQFLEWGAVFSQLRSATLDHHLFTFGWVTTNNDADYSLYALFHSKNPPPTGWNSTRYVNPKVDALLEKARSATDQPARAKMYAEVQTSMAKEPVWIPLANTKEVVVTGRYVHGFSVHPVEYNLDLSKVWLDK
ncbi:MAG TPA: ABC transporter substrate-binding protein [Candidatus Methylomirabilis sp.]|nr:ABC transporter substrate-binding protein [Candidatus Methylomirabilis sp.]